MLYLKEICHREAYRARFTIQMKTKIVSIAFYFMQTKQDLMLPPVHVHTKLAAFYSCVNDEIIACDVPQDEGMLNYSILETTFKIPV